MSDQNLRENAEESEPQILSKTGVFSGGNGDPNAATVNKLSFLGSSSHTSHSLSVLESDLRALHSKWQAVEKVIADRDERIAACEKDLEISGKRCAELEGRVETLEDEKSVLSLTLDEKNSELEALEKRCTELSGVADERDIELQKAREDVATLEKDRRRLEEEISGQSRQVSDTKKRIGTLKAEETALRVQVQELNDYIDGRKDEWQRLNEKLKAYEETISGMSESLESHDNIVATKEGEKAELACQVMKLERDLAELRGKYSEKDAGFQALQQNLEAQTKELGNLNAETIRRSKEVEKLQKKLKRRDDSIESLRSELKDGKAERSSLGKQLSEEKATIKEVQAKLDAANGRIADLESGRKQRDASAEELSATVGALRERLKASDPTIQKHEATIADLQRTISDNRSSEKALRDEIAGLSAKLEELGTRTAEQEVLLAESNAATRESLKELRNVEEELEAQRELVQVLEAELNSKQEDLDLLDRSVDRLHAIGSEVRDLDLQIDDIWRRKPQPAALDIELPFQPLKGNLLEPEEMLEEKVDDAEACAYEHLIIRENDAGGQSNRQRLNDGVSTIGRAGTNDIRVASKYISRLHARITVEGPSAVIEDAGSTNGFFVNSMHTRHHVLTSGDRLEIGDCKFRYVCSKNGLDTSGLRNGQRDH